MATQIQLRRDSYADWTSTNPTLAQGEFGFETDTGNFKIGDGSTSWTSLKYANVSKGHIQVHLGDGNIEYYTQSADTDAARGVALKAAVASATSYCNGAAGRRAVVYVGPGTYNYNNTLFYDEGVAIIGAGPQHTTFQVTYTGSPTNTFNSCSMMMNEGASTATAYTAGSGVYLANFRLYNTYGNGLVVAHVDGGTIENVHTYVPTASPNALHGFDIIGCQKVVLKNCSSVTVGSDWPTYQIDQADSGSATAWNGSAEVTVNADATSCKYISLVDCFSEQQSSSGKNVEIHRDDHKFLLFDSCQFVGGISGIVTDTGPNPGHQYITISDCLFDQSVSNATSINIRGSSGSHTTEVLISNCHIESPKFAFFFSYVTGLRVYNTIANVGSTNGGAVALCNDGGANVRFADCKFSHTDAGSPTYAVIDINGTWTNFGILDTYITGEGANYAIDAGSNNIWVHNLDATSVTAGVVNCTGEIQSPGVPVEFAIALSDETTDLAVGDGKAYYHVPWNMRITEIIATVNTAPTGSGITVDIESEGASIFTTTLLTIANGSDTSVGGTAPNITTKLLTKDHKLKFNIDAVGSTTKGKGLKVTVKGVTY